MKRKKKKAEKPEYPAATMAFYGPTDQLATKVVVAIVKQQGGNLSTMHRWITAAGDVRKDPVIGEEIAQFLKKHRVKTVAQTGRIIGCPHEEGVDYPQGSECPLCAFWYGRDRFTGELKKGWG